MKIVSYTLWANCCGHDITVQRSRPVPPLTAVPDTHPHIEARNSAQRTAAVLICPLLCCICAMYCSTSSSSILERSSRLPLYISVMTWETCAWAQTRESQHQIKTCTDCLFNRGRLCTSMQAMPWPRYAWKQLTCGTSAHAFFSFPLTLCLRSLNAKDMISLSGAIQSCP